VDPADRKCPPISLKINQRRRPHPLHPERLDAPFEVAVSPAPSSLLYRLLLLRPLIFLQVCPSAPLCKKTRHVSTPSSGVQRRFLAESHEATTMLLPCCWCDAPRSGTGKEGERKRGARPQPPNLPTYSPTASPICSASRSGQVAPQRWAADDGSIDSSTYFFAAPVHCT
jgi:hypothetical protein